MTSFDNLPRLSSLLHLDLSSNILHNQCDFQLLFSLYPNLIQLDLSFNKIKDLNNLNELFLYFKGTLKSLNLTGNPIIQGKYVSNIRPKIF
jgi:hypothetical protein